MQLSVYQDEFIKYNDDISLKIVKHTIVQDDNTIAISVSAINHKSNNVLCQMGIMANIHTFTSKTQKLIHDISYSLEDIGIMRNLW